jgi:pimeloyl-ACP methyl ester carboxylesterase
MGSTTSPGEIQADQSESGGHRRFRFRYVLIGTIVFVVGLGSLGAIYQAISVRADQRKFLPPGQFVDLGGRQIHMLVQGQSNGKPTVLLEAGIAGFSSNWAWVQNELAQITQVVSYDRAGLGWSDPAPETKDAQQSAQDLHAALQKAGIQGPYIIAGHSYGGLVVRAFTDLYPGEVAGMVLVDASHPDQWLRIPASKGGQTVAFGNRVEGFLVRLGIARLFNMNKSTYAGLPEKQAAEMKAILNMPKSWSTSAGVLSIWDKRTREQIEQAHDLGNLPLVVFSVTDQPSSVAATLTSLQDELPGLSTNSIHVTVEGATHEGLIAKQEYATEVARAIQKVIEAAETGAPLASQ